MAGEKSSGQREKKKLRQSKAKERVRETQRIKEEKAEQEQTGRRERKKRLHRKVLRTPTFPKNSKEEMPPMTLTGQTSTRPRINASTGSWKLQKRHLRNAIEHGKIHSARGPDGLPYAFWKSIPDLAEEVLWDTLTTLAREDSTTLQDEAYASEPYTFNGSLLACLPKTPSQVAKDGTAIYAPSSTRPLSISNTDNRLISVTMKHSWEPILAQSVHPHQRGFLDRQIDPSKCHRHK